MELKVMNKDIQERCKALSNEEHVECNMKLKYEKKFETYELQYYISVPEQRDTDGIITKARYTESGSDYVTRQDDESELKFEARCEKMLEERMFKMNLYAKRMLDADGKETRRW